MFINKMMIIIGSSVMTATIMTSSTRRIMVSRMSSAATGIMSYIRSSSTTIWTTIVMSAATGRISSGKSVASFTICILSWEKIIIKIENMIKNVVFLENILYIILWMNLVSMKVLIFKNG